MSVLEGAFAAEFYNAFADIYSDAVLTRVTMTDVNGTLTPSETNQDIKAQRDDLSEAARASAGYGEREVSILVLRQGADEMDANCKITLYGEIYEVSQCRSDPVSAYWQCRCVKA